jgi:hypothetical protein
MSKACHVNFVQGHIEKGGSWDELSLE